LFQCCFNECFIINKQKIKSKVLRFITIKIFLALGAVILGFAPSIFGQDIQFSQFYGAALYLNPAFAGGVHYDRLTFHQRLQWPSIDAKYITSYFSYDRYFDKYKSGIGITALKDFQGKNTINSTELGIQYTYEIGISEKLALRPGLQLGYIKRSVDYTTLLYPDQFNNQGTSGAQTLDPHASTSKVSFLDISAGGIFYSKKLWISYAGHHLNKPNQSYWANEVSILPVKHSFTSGYRIPIIKGEEKAHIGHRTRSFFIIPTVHYKIQGKSDQVDLGIYGWYSELVAGIWYRGIPVKKYLKNLQNNESMVVLVGWRIKEFRLSYSYDFTVSKLSVARTGGSHELNVTYIFRKKKKAKTMKVLPCPEN
jgi:type IX secretion system PorP/SprF family membrane protein